MQPRQALVWKYMAGRCKPLSLVNRTNMQMNLGRRGFTFARQRIKSKLGWCPTPGGGCRRTYRLASQATLARTNMGIR